MNNGFLAFSLALACSLIAAVAVFLMTGLPAQLPPWVLPKSSIFAGLLFAGALAGSIIALNIPPLRKRIPFGSLGSALVLGAIFCLPVLVVLLVLANGFADLPKLQGDNPVLLTLLVAFTGMLVINGLPVSRMHLLAINAVILAGAMVPSVIGYLENEDAEIAVATQTSSAAAINYVFGSVHDAKVSDYLIFPKRKRHGGGLNILDKSRVLLVAGDGEIVLLDVARNDIQVTPTKLKTPFDLDDYDKFADDRGYFRLLDALLETKAGQPAILYVAYHHWDVEQSCVTLKVAEAAFDLNSIGQANLEWTERFRSYPCLKDHLNNETGGRLAFLGDDTLLVTLGVSIGRWDDQALADSSYGKIIALDRGNWEARVFSRGHRNAQGLLVLEDGAIWSTEHGPKGGDELNFVREGMDYGWPMASYGTAYGKKTYRPESPPGDHTFGERPIYAWVPSIGISNLISVEGNAFPAWQGDLIVSSLEGRVYGKSLFRVKIADRRVVVSERMRTGLRVRDLVELEDGRLLLWQGRDTVQVVEPADMAFSDCSGCHNMDLRMNLNGIGPPLMGIVGAPVARNDEFDYSNAMKNFGGIWTRKRLDDYLSDPAGTIPGTTMGFTGIADPGRRAAIIDYLQGMQPSKTHLD